MIVSAELQFKWRRRVRRKDALQFAPGLNTLAGPNGSGKSTIIQALLDGGDCRLQFEGSSEIRLFDTERMNPRVLATPAATRPRWRCACAEAIPHTARLSARRSPPCRPARAA